MVRHVRAFIEEFSGTWRDDVYAGTPDTDIAFGYGGRDRLAGQDGDDILHGNTGRDTLFGGNGGDELRGDGGRDILRGGSGTDFLYGGQGDDVLNGGANSDFMKGGIGADRFVFTGDDIEGDDTWVNTVFDFSRAQGDRIDLRTVNKAGGYSDTPLVFIGSDEFSGQGGEVRYEIVGGVTFLEIDVLNIGDWNYGERWDFVVKVNTVIDFVASDFML